MIRLVMVAAFLFACSSKKGDTGPSCDKVVERMVELLRQTKQGQDMAALDDRKKLVDQCEQRKLPASVRACMVDAKSFSDFAACRPRDKNAPAPTGRAPAPTRTPPPMPPGHPPVLTPSTPPAAPAPAAPPAGSGSGS
jgi:hypothetical protein